MADDKRLFEQGKTWQEAAESAVAQQGKRKGMAITVTRLRDRAKKLGLIQ